MPSIKKNFMYSSVLTAANYIFPLITYPYVSRVLGVTNIGICNFVDSIINYFVLFSMMGIGIVGIREIAKSKGDKEELDKTFNSLFTLNTVSTTIMLAALAVAIYTVPKLYEHRSLMWVGALKLISNYLLIEWFYKGLEEFRYITVRSIAIKAAYVVSVLVLIHTKDDYPIYYLLMSLTIAANAVLNIAYSRRFIRFSFPSRNIGRHFKPFMTLGFYALLTSMYTSFNVACLGFVSGETEVGYYSTATKIYTILLSLYSAFTGVMLPRMSQLLGDGDFEKFKELLSRSCNILMAFAVPTAIYSVVMTPEIIYIISGEGYEGAILPMRIVMPLMVIIGYEQILVIQTLMPLKQDKTILRNSAVGAFVGILLNVLLVPHLASVGSSIVWFLSEITILCLSQTAVSKTVATGFPWRQFAVNISCNIPLIPLLFSIKHFVRPMSLYVPATCLLFIAYAYFVNVKILKNNDAVRLADDCIRFLNKIIKQEAK